MKRITYLLSIACVVVLAAASTTASIAQEKRVLSDEHILGRLPDGIVNPTPFPMQFTQNNQLLFSEGRAFYTYDLDKGLRKEYNYKPKMSAASFDELVQGWKNPTLSPDSTMIAYTLDNDLYSINVRTKQITRHTYDGTDLILNGYASWVYYEEILGRPSQYKAFWWSPDSKVLAFYRFDNTKVQMFPIYNSVGQHGSLNQTRYPKAGDDNPTVRVGFVSVNGGETVWADFDEKEDQYFGIPFWNGEGNKFMVAWMPRSQDDLILYSVNPLTGQKEHVYKEHQDSWIDWMDQMLFTQEGIYIVRDFEGWQQIYYLTYDGRRFEKLTDGNNWSIRLLKADKKYLFYTAKRENSTRVDIYRVTLKNAKNERVSFGDYNFASVVISDDNTNIAALASNSRTPTKLVNISIPKSGNLSRAKVTTIVDTKGPVFDQYAIAMPEVVTITTRDGLQIPATVIWPVNMDKNKKYPVKVNIYGGPDSPQVSDTWKGVTFRNQWWANHGVIQVVLDTRSSGHLGKKGLNMVYRQLAFLEIDDFIDGIKYFTAMPFVDKEKVGIEGFSFGGTMTTLCVTLGSDYFKYGIAGGGVYDWSLYDSHYTERYMDTPQDNPDGYAKTKVYDRIGNYKGDKSNMLRLTHGTGDDNVHFQNTLQLIDRLHKENKDFELMIYPQGMHGYRGYQGQHSSMQDYIFWYRYLLDSDIPQNLLDYFKK